MVHVNGTLFYCTVNTGHLHVQVNGQMGESSAFLTTYQVPLSEWCELSVVLQGRTVSMSQGKTFVLAEASVLGDLK